MKFSSLGSGSEGNALVISSASGAGCTTVMLDCGFAIKETERRLQRVGLAPSDLDAIIVTHEHKDHVGGAFKFARRHGIPVWLTHGTYQAVRKDGEGVICNFCRDGVAFAIGGIKFTPYTVPHDAREPVQFVACDGQFRLGVLTDAGHSTPHVINALSGCDALVLECNHDRDMLATSQYPPSLRNRIGGAFGHLSNDTSAGILAAIDKSRLKIVVGAHLSKENNTASLARDALQGAMQATGARLEIACQEDGFDWVVLDR